MILLSIALALAAPGSVTQTDPDNPECYSEVTLPGETDPGAPHCDPVGGPPPPPPPGYKGAATADDDGSARLLDIFKPD